MSETSFNCRYLNWSSYTVYHIYVIFNVKKPAKLYIKTERKSPTSKIGAKNKNLLSGWLQDVTLK